VQAGEDGKHARRNQASTGDCPCRPRCREYRHRSNLCGRTGPAPACSGPLATSSRSKLPALWSSVACRSPLRRARGPARGRRRGWRRFSVPDGGPIVRSIVLPLLPPYLFL